MFKFNNDLFLTSDIFDENIFSFFSTKKLSFYPFDKKIFLTIRKVFPFVKELIFVKQFHSNVVVEYPFIDEKKLSDGLIKADGIVSKSYNTALAVFTGDCLPVILSDGEVIGIYHAGWKGSLENIAEKMIEKMLKLGVKIDNLKVALGPSIGDCCYFIDLKRAEKFSRKYHFWKDKILLKRGSKIYLNFSLLNYLQLISLGVKKENIDFFPFCTSCDRRFYSFRRDKKLEKEMVNFVIKI